MTEKKKLLWNVAMILLSFVGIFFFALQFAVAIDLGEYRRVFIFFFLSACSVETLFFSSKRLITSLKNRKQNSP